MFALKIHVEFSFVRKTIVTVNRQFVHYSFEEIFYWFIFYYKNLLSLIFS